MDYRHILKPHRGNSILEYALPLIFFVGAGGILLTLVGVPDYIQDYVNDTLMSRIENKSLKVPALGVLATTRGRNGSTGASPVLPGGGTGSGPQGGMVITLQNGQQVHLSNYPLDLVGSIETTGANGTTRVLASTMEEFIAKLVASGELDAAQANLLRDLSNQGHKMAQIQNAIEQAAPGAGTWQNFQNLTFTHEGKTMTGEQYLYLVGWPGPRPDQITDPLNQPDKAGAEIRRFQDLYHAAVAGGALNSPQAKAVVTALAEEILVVSEHFEHTVGFDKTVADVSGEMASSITHYDSKHICNTGGGPDTGVKCL